MRTISARLLTANRFTAAFTRTELFALLAILALLITILAWGLSKQQADQRRAVCRDNLKNIALAVRIWNENAPWFPSDVSTNAGGAKEYTNVWRHFQVLSNGLDGKLELLICPATPKSPAKTWSALRDSNISYFIGLTAEETYPQSFLSGDTPFLISGSTPSLNPFPATYKSDISYPSSVHRGTANIAMGDGSVAQLKRDFLKSHLANSGLETNLLLFPR